MDPEKSSDTNSCSSYNNGKNNSDNVDVDKLSYGKVGVSFSSISTMGKNFPNNRSVKIHKLLGPLSENTLKGVAEYILSEKVKNILVVTGAGISTSAGIPDFRSQNTGIYNNLDKYDLPCREALFNISYFRSNPKPLYDVGKHLLETVFNAKPTLTHYFIKLLQDKNVLLRNYTQNIDGLERLAGLDKNIVVEAHGTLSTASCIDCLKKVNIEQFYDNLKNDIISLCEYCNGYVKPDIIFFGEPLPDLFFHHIENDCKKCDLIIIMGTSLSTYPINLLTQFVPQNIPRLLINKERVGMFHIFDDETSSNITYSETSSLSEAKKTEITAAFNEALYEKTSAIDEMIDIENENMNFTIYDRDVIWLGNCDDGCKELIQHLGWNNELNSYLST